MPRIRLLQSVAGPDFSWVAGDEVDLPGAEASKWADGVRAELVRGEKAETPERATRRSEPAKRRTAKSADAEPAEQTADESSD